MASKPLQSTIEIAGVLSPSLQAAIKNAVGKLEEMSEETLQSAGAAEKLSVEIAAQESVLKSLQKGYADYVVSGREGSSEAQTLADKIQELSGDLDANKGALQTAENAAKQLANVQDDTADASRELGDATEDAGRQAENSSEGYTVLKNVIANLATEAIGKAVDAFKELATEGDTALGMLEAKTGATGQKMEGFEDVMYEVYNANYGESLGDVSEKLSTVIQMTDDLDNASLAKVTKSAIALEDVFGYDVNESMRAVNSLMDQFGITSDQAFNLVVQGAQNGLDQNGDLLDTINEYSVQFKNAGYSADDMFNMLANGTESGTWSVDKLGDAVKEFNIRASDGTISDAIVENAKAFGMTRSEAKALGKEVKGGSVEAYQKLLDKLKEVDDDSKRYQMGVEMFGTMWEDLGEDAVFALMDTEGAISKTSNAMEKMDAAAYDTLESSLSQLGRTIKAEVVQPIAEKLIPVAKEAVQFVTSKVGPAVDWILNNLPTISVLIAGISAAVVAFKWGSIVSGIMKAVGAVKAFGAALMANPVGLIILAVTALVAAFVHLWKNCEGFRNFWIKLWEGIKNAVGVAVDWIKGCWEKIKAFFTGDNVIARYFQMGWANIKIVWDTVVSYFKTIWENIKLVFSAVKSVLSGDFSGAWEKIKQIFANWGSFFSGLIDNCKKIFSNIANFFGPIFSNAWSKIKGAFSNVGGWFKEKFTQGKNNAQAAWSNAKEVFGNAWSKTKSAFSNVGGWFKEKFAQGKNNAVSAWSNVQSLFSNVKNRIISVFSNIKEKLTAPFQRAKEIIQGIVDKLKKVFNFSWSLPKLKLPHISVTGGKAPFGIAGKGSLPKFSIEWYKDGGIMTSPTVFGINPATGSLMAGGEAGAEAVLPLSVLWDKLEAIMRRILNSESSAGEPSGEGLTSKAGELLTLDNFSLGSLADGTNVYIYYDFSNFTWSPQIQNGGTGDDEDDIIARLKAHEAEFFDWLEEFIQMREVAQYA